MSLVRDIDPNARFEIRKTNGKKMRAKEERKGEGSDPNEYKEKNADKGEENILSRGLAHDSLETTMRDII